MISYGPVCELWGTHCIPAALATDSDSRWQTTLSLSAALSIPVLFEFVVRSKRDRGNTEDWGDIVKEIASAVIDLTHSVQIVSGTNEVL